MAEQGTPLWEVFIRSRNGLAHKHVGSVHAADATMALAGGTRRVHAARGGAVALGGAVGGDRRLRSGATRMRCSSRPGSKIYRHPTFYEVPDDVGNM